VIMHTSTALIFIREVLSSAACFTAKHLHAFTTGTLTQGHSQKNKIFVPPPPSLQSKVRYMKGGKLRPEGMECLGKKCGIRRALKASLIQGQPHELSPPPHSNQTPFSFSLIPLKQRNFSLSPLLWREAGNNQFFPQKFSVSGSKGATHKHHSVPTAV